jgi:hypothetical protein
VRLFPDFLPTVDTDAGTFTKSASTWALFREGASCSSFQRPRDHSGRSRPWKRCSAVGCCRRSREHH